MVRPLAIDVRLVLVVYLQAVLLHVKTLACSLIVPVVGEQDGPRLLNVIVQVLDSKPLTDFILTLVF